MAFYSYKNNLKELIPYVLLVILIYTFSSLGMWQLDRAKEKKEAFTNNTPTVIKSSVLRIMSELTTLQNALPNFWDTSIIFRSSDEEIYKFSFVITGPIDTPYHNGIFEFHGIKIHKFISS